MGHLVVGYGNKYGVRCPKGAAQNATYLAYVDPVKLVLSAYYYEYESDFPYLT